VTTIYRRWWQTRLVESKTRTGSLTMSYDPSPVAVHAAKEVYGVRPTEMVCGRMIPANDDVKDTFAEGGSSAVVGGCAQCCSALGLEPLDL
jgi:hypothetical protein